MLENMAKAPKSIIGIDCSTKSLAYAKFVNGEFLDCGQMFFDGNDIWQRLNSAHEMIPPLVNVGVLEADLIVFESAVMVGNNPKTAISLAYVYGACIGALCSSGAKVAKVPPLTWQAGIGNPNLTTAEKAGIRNEFPGKSKSWYLAKGREVRKNRTLEFARKYAPIHTDSNDVGDAIGLCFYATKNWRKLEW